MDILNGSEVGRGGLVVFLMNLIAGVWNGQHIVLCGVARDAPLVGLPGFVTPGGMLCRCPKSRTISDVR